jgi:hypothetical protein
MISSDPKIHPRLKAQAFPLTHFNVGNDVVGHRSGCRELPGNHCAIGWVALVMESNQQVCITGLLSASSWIPVCLAGDRNVHPTTGDHRSAAGDPTSTDQLQLISVLKASTRQGTENPARLRNMNRRRMLAHLHSGSESHSPRTSGAVAAFFRRSGRCCLQGL